MNITTSVSKYHDLKLSLNGHDPLFAGVNGNLKKWRAGKVLGHGSRGQVFKAFDTETGGLFSVKRLMFNKDSS